MLLHAGAGLDGSIFLPGAEALAATHRLLLVDLPGNGQLAGRPRSGRSRRSPRAVEELVRERGLEDWTLLGHSFGGFVAMQHLVDFPGSAARLIASCTDADEEPAPGAGDPEAAYENLPPEVEAAFEREERVTSDEEARAGLARPGAVLRADARRASRRCARRSPTSSSATRGCATTTGASCTR